MVHYESKIGKLKSNIKLYKPTVSTVVDLAEDFNLGQFSEEKVEIKYFDGNHVSILDNPELAKEINKDLGVQTILDNKDTIIGVERISTHQEAVKR